MKYGICQVVISPGRLEPADESEIRMQLVFGDLVRIIEVQDNWTQLEMVKYDYSCWVDTKHIAILNETEFNSILNQKEVRVRDYASSILNENNEIIHLVKGCILPNYKDKKLFFGSQSFTFLGNTNENISKSKNEIVKTALEYLNSPYLWGGNSPYGIDCSGLTQMSYSLHGTQIPRDASEQVKIGETIQLVEESEPGDLAYFDNKEGIITHVGIILGNNEIIHASGHTRIDKLDHQGIYRKDFGRYTHNLRIIKKII